MNKALLGLSCGLADVTARSPDPRAARGPSRSLARSLAHSLAQVTDDVFEDFVVFLGEAAQDVLHGLEALLPVVDL